MSTISYICPNCGQWGNESPGFSVLPYPEAVGNLDGMVAVHSFRCNKCKQSFVVPVGTLEIRHVNA